MESIGDLWGILKRVRMGESAGTDDSEAGEMGKPYSQDLRVRVIRAAASGGSCREAARIFGVSASASIKWVQRFRRTGSLEAKPRGGHSRSPLAPHADWLLLLIGAEPDLTLQEIRTRLKHQGMVVGIGSIWRFFDRHGISFKKNRARRRAGTARRGRGAWALEGRSAPA